MSVIWTPKGTYSIASYRNEADLESAILQIQSQLFGRNRIYLDVKKKIGSKGGLRNIPDGYLIDLNGLKPRLYLVENELASHDPLRHVAVQLLEFSLSFASERRAIKTILFNALQSYPTAKALCEQFARARNYRNLDHMLDEMVFDAPFAALVIIDEMSDKLQTVLAEKFRFGVEVLQVSRYTGIGGESLYHFEPFLAGIGDDLAAPAEAKDTERPLDVEEVDTVVVPAQSEGFQETFLLRSAIKSKMPVGRTAAETPKLSLVLHAVLSKGKSLARHPCSRNNAPTDKVYCRVPNPTYLSDYPYCIGEFN